MTDFLFYFWGCQIPEDYLKISQVTEYTLLYGKGVLLRQLKGRPHFPPLNDLYMIKTTLLKG